MSTGVDPGGFLVDTNVISESRKGQRANPGVRAWFNAVARSDLWLSVIVIGEIRKGVELARPHDPTQAIALEHWLTGLRVRFADAILPVTPEIADRWGKLSAIRTRSAVDGLLAATALVHGLTFVTRNLAHVAHAGVNVVNPFK